MSLDVYIKVNKPCVVFDRNITHNLAQMASEVGLYLPLWRPEEIGIVTARDLIPHLQEGLVRLRTETDRLQKFNPSNGWGTYSGFVSFVSDYLEACLDNPDGTIEASR